MGLVCGPADQALRRIERLPLLHGEPTDDDVGTWRTALFEELSTGHRRRAAQASSHRTQRNRCGQGEPALAVNGRAAAQAIDMLVTRLTTISSKGFRPALQLLAGLS